MPDGSIIDDAARAAIGKEAPPIAEEVSRGAIRRFARAVFDTNPLHTDDEAAAAGPNGGIVAPLAFFLTLGKQFIDEPHSLRPQLGLPHGVAGGDEWHFFAPMRPGDVITRRTKLANLYEKSGRLGPMVFLAFEHTYTNQRGEVAVRAFSTSIAYSSSGRARGAAALAAAAAAHNEGAGRELAPPLSRRIGMLEIVRFGAMTEQLGSGHIDKDFARNVLGLPDVNVPAGLKAGMLCTMLSRWCGARGVVQRVSCQYRGMDFCGDTLTAGASVARAEVRDGRRVLECDVWIENHRGERNTRGAATVVMDAG